jgi:hypothetical protein
MLTHPPLADNLIGHFPLNIKVVSSAARKLTLNNGHMLELPVNSESDSHKATDKGERTKGITEAKSLGAE